MVKTGLPLQGVQVQSLVGELDSMCRKAQPKKKEISYKKKKPVGGRNQERLTTHPRSSMCQ